MKSTWFLVDFLPYKIYLLSLQGALIGGVVHTAQKNDETETQIFPYICFSHSVTQPDVIYQSWIKVLSIILSIVWDYMLYNNSFCQTQHTKFN